MRRLRAVVTDGSLEAECSFITAENYKILYNYKAKQHFVNLMGAGLHYSLNQDNHKSKKYNRQLITNCNFWL